MVIAACLGCSVAWGQADNKAELKPILKQAPARAALKPIVKGEEATPTPAAEATPVPVKLTPQTRERKPEAEPETKAREAESPARKAARPVRERAPQADPFALESLLKMEPSLVARQQLRQWLPSHRNEPGATRAMLRIAEISEKLNEPVEARAMYEEILATEAGAGEKQQARAALARLVPAPQAVPAGSVMLMAGFELAERGKYAEARQNWSSVLKQFSAQAPASLAPEQQAVRAAALLGLGLCDELQGQIESARSNYQLAQESAPGTADARLAGERLADLKQPLIR